MPRRLGGDDVLPRTLGGCSPDFRSGRGWPVAPAGDEGHVNVRGSAALDEQRLQTSWAALGSATSGALGVDAESDDLPQDRRPLLGVGVGAV
jgi:hypothetical protein